MHPRLLLVALQLLTRLPVGQPWRRDPDTADSVGWFPVVGALVGGVAAFAWWTTSLAFPPAMAATISVAVTVALTGALHEDGLADTADGFFGGSTPDRRLAIMRDATLGTYGVLAIVLTVLLRVTLLAGLQPVQGAAALVVSGAVGRGVLGMSLGGTVPASTSGSGAALLDHLRVWPSAVAAVVAAGFAVGLLGVPGALMLLSAGVSARGVRSLAVRRIGGANGDVMGAMILTGEMAALFTGVALDAGAALR